MVEGQACRGRGGTAVEGQACRGRGMGWKMEEKNGRDIRQYGDALNKEE